MCDPIVFCVYSSIVSKRSSYWQIYKWCPFDCASVVLCRRACQVNWLTTTIRWQKSITPTDCPKSGSNRCVIKKVLWLLFNCFVLIVNRFNQTSRLAIFIPTDRPKLFFFLEMTHETHAISRNILMIVLIWVTEAYSCHVKEKKICRYNDIYVVITTYYVVITTYDGCRYNEILCRYNDIISRYNDIFTETFLDLYLLTCSVILRVNYVDILKFSAKSRTIYVDLLNYYLICRHYFCA